MVQLILGYLSYCPTECTVPYFTLLMSDFTKKLPTILSFSEFLNRVPLKKHQRVKWNEVFKGAHTRDGIVDLIGISPPELRQFLEHVKVLAPKVPAPIKVFAIAIASTSPTSHYLSADEDTLDMLDCIIEDSNIEPSVATLTEIDSMPIILELYRHYKPAKLPSGYKSAFIYLKTKALEPFMSGKIDEELPDTGSLEGIS